MPKFRIHWTETVIQHWYLDVDADDEEEAKQIFYDGCHVTGDEVLGESDGIDSSFDDVESICDHDFVDVSNEGVYGYEICRYCGEKQDK